MGRVRSAERKRIFKCRVMTRSESFYKGGRRFAGPWTLSLSTLLILIIPLGGTSLVTFLNARYRFSILIK